MKTSLLQEIAWLWYFVVAPWITGSIVIVVVSLLRVLLYSPQLDSGEFHFHLIRTYFVASRRMSVLFLVVLSLIAIGLSVVISQRVTKVSTPELR